MVKMKYWNELEDKNETIVDMAFNLTDLNIFSEDTLRHMYNDMNGITDDVFDNPNTIDI